MIPEKPSRALGRALLAILVSTTLAMIPAFRDVFLLPKEICLALGVPVALGLALYEGRELPVIRRGWPVTALALFLVGMLLSSPGARAPVQAWDGVAVYLGALGFVWLACAAGESFRLGWPRVVIALALIQVGIGAIEMARLSPPRGFFHFPRRLLFVGTLGNPEYVAAYLGIAFLLSAHERTAWRRGALVALAIGILFTDCRGAWLALLFTLWVLPPRGSRFGRGALWLHAVSLPLLAIRLGLVRTTLGSLRGRFLIWLASLEMIVKSRGIGVGLGNFQYHFYEAQKKLFENGGWPSLWDNAAMVQRAHDDLLDFLAEGGLAMGAALVIALGLVLRRGWQRREESQSRALLSVVLFTLLVGIGSFPLHILPTLLCFGLACAGLLAGTPSRSLSVRFRVVLSLLLVPATLALLHRDARRAGAQLLHARAYEKLEAEEFETALEETRRGLALCPDDYFLRVTQGRLLYKTFHSREALQEVEKLLRTGRIIDTVKLEGLARMDIDDWAGAFRAYDELAHVYPHQVTPHYYLGRIYERWGRIEEARREFGKAMALPAKNQKARLDQRRILETVPGLG